MTASERRAAVVHWSGSRLAPRPAVAVQLLASGVPAVLAMQFPVGDDYASLLAKGFYAALSTTATADPARALAIAKSRIHDMSTGKALPASWSDWEEWGTPALWCGAGGSPRLNIPARSSIDSSAPRSKKDVGGVPADLLVPRHIETRRVVSELASGDRNIVMLTGVAGTGKSVLASQVSERLREMGWVVSRRSGPTSADQIMADVARQMRRGGGEWKNLLKAVPTSDGRLLLCLVLDDFDANVDDSGRLKDAELAEFLVAAATNSPRLAVILTCRHAVRLPVPMASRARAMQPSPMSRSETRMLLRRLPVLSRHPEWWDEVYGRWGGHPQLLTVLDQALGRTSSRRVASGTRPTGKRGFGVQKPQTTGEPGQSGLQAAGRLAVSELSGTSQVLQLLRSLDAHTRDVLKTLAVFRRPVPSGAVQSAFACRRLADRAIASKVALPGWGAMSYFVHRWLADAALEGDPGILERHRHAAHFWRVVWGGSDSPTATHETRSNRARIAAHVSGLEALEEEVYHWAMVVAVGGGLPLHNLELGKANLRLATVLHQDGRWEEAKCTARAALDALSNSSASGVEGSVSLLVNAHCLLSDITWNLSDYAAAAEHAKAAVSLAETHARNDNLVRERMRYAKVRFDQGMFSEAEQVLLGGLGGWMGCLAEVPAGSEIGAVESMSFLGHIYKKWKNDLCGARRYYEQSREAAVAFLQDRVGTGGDSGKLRRKLEYWVAQNDRRIGEVELLDGNLERAQDRAVGCRWEFRRLEEPCWEANALLLEAKVHMARHEWTEALDALGNAHDTFPPDDRYGLTQGQRLRGLVNVMQGEKDGLRLLAEAEVRFLKDDRGKDDPLWEEWARTRKYRIWASKRLKVPPPSFAEIRKRYLEYNPEMERLWSQELRSMGCN